MELVLPTKSWPVLGVLIVLASGFDAARAQSSFEDPFPPFLEDVHIRVVGPEDGLPASYIRRLVRGRDGQLYASTYRGIVRLFAGYAEPIEFPGYSYDGILFVEESPAGDLWVVAQNGRLGVFKDGNTILHNHLLPRTTDLTSTSDGSMWMKGTALSRFRLQDGIIVESDVPLPPKIDTGLITHIVEVPEIGVVGIGERRSVVLSPGPVRSIGPSYELASSHRRDVLTGHGAVWLPTHEGLLRIGPDAYEFHEPGTISHAETGWGEHDATRLIDRNLVGMLRFPGLGAGQEILRAYMATDHTVWAVVQTPDIDVPVLVRIRGNQVEQLNLKEHLDFNEINGIVEDHEGSIWLRTDLGLIQLASRRVKALTGAHGLQESFTTGLVEARGGGVLIGTWGAGIHVFEGGRMAHRITEAEGLPSDNVRTMFQDRSGRIWAGTRRGPALIQGREATSIPLPFPASPIRAFAQDENCLWIASMNRLGCYREGRVFPALQDHAGFNIWDIESLPDGRLLVAAEQGLFISGKPDESGIPQVLRRIPIPQVEDLSWMVMLHTTSDGSVWASSYNDGMFRVFLQNGAQKVVRIGPEDGLHSSGVWSMVEDDHGNVWMSSDHGVGMVPLSELTAAAQSRFTGQGMPGIRPLVFRENEGVPNRESNRTGSGGIRLSDGRLLFNSIAGVSVIDPIQAIQPYPSPRVILSNVDLDGQRVNPEAGLFKVAPGVHQLKVTVSALSYVAPSQTVYRHRIDGYDSNWIYDGPDRTITYTELPHGRQTLYVQASVGGGQWTPDPLVIGLDVVPHWWEGSPFRFGLPVFLVMIVLALFRMQHRRQESLERAVAERTTQLRHEKDKTARQAEQLRSKAARLARLDASRSRFFANVSHEIRTPLTNVSLVLDHLCGAPATSRDSTLLDTARTNLERLKRLSDDIGILSRVDCGELAFRPCEGDVWQAIQEIVLAHAPMAEQNAVSLQTRLFVEPSQQKAVPAHFDRKLLGHVLGNFISNGVKFSSAGGKVQICLEPHVDYLDIRVRDTGMGIEAGDMHHLFDRFYQSDDGIVRGFEGMGLGLAVVKEVSERIGGILQVDSTPGMGSTFSIRLPRWYQEIDLTPPGKAGMTKSDGPVPGDGRNGTDPGVLNRPAASAALPSDRSASSATPPFEQMRPKDYPNPGPARLLVVEDNPDTGKLVADLLRRAGLEDVYIASNAHRARASIGQHLPDVIVTDVMMPGEDGLTFLDGLRRSEETAEIPVLVVSARSGPKYRAEAFIRGADAYLEKPFDEDELVSRLVRLLNSRDQFRKRYSARLELADTSRPIPSADERFVRDARDAVLGDMKDIRVDDLADVLAVSPQHLRRKMKSATGFSPSEFIRAIRLEEARLRLEVRSDQIQQVALEVGYRDVGTFRNHFKARYGQLPSEVAG